MLEKCFWIVLKFIFGVVYLYYVLILVLFCLGVGIFNNIVFNLGVVFFLVYKRYRVVVILILIILDKMEDIGVCFRLWKSVENLIIYFFYIVILFLFKRRFIEFRFLCMIMFVCRNLIFLYILMVIFNCWERVKI